jgi:hypothetical protein
MEEILTQISGTQVGALGVLLLFILREIKDFVLKILHRRDRDAQGRATDLVIKQIHARLNFIQNQIMKYLRDKK